MSCTTATLVFYNSGLEEVEPVLRRLREDRSIAAWVVVDNSAKSDRETATALHNLVCRLGGRYVAAPKNLGFGAGHNLGLRALADVPTEFHVMLNPDLDFDTHILSELAEAMSGRSDVGMLMPRVRYPDGVSQSHCHLLPAPIDLALRRFGPPSVKKSAQRRMERYALANFDRSRNAEIPFLTGCFMFVRRAVLESIGGFDERFFLYMEDVDLCRRLGQVSKLLYWPSIAITHAHRRGSYKSRKLMLLHARSAIAYFNKWGWLFDSERDRINREALSRLPMLRPSAIATGPAVAVASGLHKAAQPSHAHK